jgi:hypothetical protein
MLSSLGGPLARLLPAGVSDVPGMRALVNLGDRASEYVDSTVGAGQRAGANAREAYRQTAGAALLAALVPLERAEALKSLLVKARVPTDRIKISECGSTKPAAEDETSEDDTKKDRIELWFEKN